MSASYDSSRNIARTVRRLLGITVLMFGFGFALVPLYDVFCEITGLNGKTDGKRYEYPVSASTTESTQETHEVIVQFLAVNNESIAWEFRPTLHEATIRAGGVIKTSYYAKNTSGRDMTVQAVPSIAPGKAAKYVRKFECFCFERQTLAVNEERNMALRFELASDLPPDIGQISLSYTLFDASDFKLN